MDATTTTHIVAGILAIVVLGSSGVAGAIFAWNLKRTPGYRTPGMAVRGRSK